MILEDSPERQGLVLAAKVSMGIKESAGPKGDADSCYPIFCHPRGGGDPVVETADVMK